MAVSKFTSASNANDFNINIMSTYSTATLDREYPSGSYSIVSSVNDTSIDVYAYNSLGTLVGYTGTKAFTATAGFSKLVILGGTAGDILGFSYKTTFTTAAETAEITAGPALISATPTTLANANATLTLTGVNFASGMSVTFTGTDSVARGAKSVVVGSTTSAIVTRPDTLPVSASPYTLSAANLGVSSPVGSNSYILSSPTISAGVAPSWITASGALTQAFYSASYSYTLSATDADAGSAVTYAVTAGALPPGLSLNSSSGAITGTPTNNANTSYSFSITVTDSGANTATQSFSITNNAAQTINYLVVGGGGGGGYDAAGGGGAGGLVVGSLLFASGTISVGSGGNGGNGSYGGTGGGSVLTGASVTVTAYGGGGGGTGGSNGQNGGSGGGSGYTSGLVGGAVYQPSPAGGTGYAYAGGSAPATVQYSGAGGGGAGGVGAANNAGGTGGAGYSSSITGTSLYYAGGGGAGGANNANGGSGVGGHGAPGSAGAAGSAGATNTGSGGGGGGYSGLGGNGAAGIVIISYSNTLPALGTIPGTITYTVNSNVSGNRVYQFTGGSGVVGF
jgi:hypothetical protein